MRKLFLIFFSCFAFFTMAENNDLVGPDVTVSIYPNPASEYLILTPKKQYSDLTFRIFNSVGVEVYQDELDSVKKIDLSDFKSTVYIVSFYLEGECVKTERFIVRH